MIDLVKVKAVLEAKGWLANYQINPMYRDGRINPHWLYARRETHSQSFVIKHNDTLPRFNSGGSIFGGEILTDEVVADIIFIRDVVRLCLIEKEET
jgi:hypothetical protein